MSIGDCLIKVYGRISVFVFVGLFIGYVGALESFVASRCEILL